MYFDCKQIIQPNTLDKLSGSNWAICRWPWSQPLTYNLCISLLFFSWADKAFELMHTFMDKAITLYWNTLYLNQSLISLQRNFLVTYWLCTSGYVSSTCLFYLLLMKPVRWPWFCCLLIWGSLSSGVRIHWFPAAPVQDPPFPLANLKVYQTLC